METHFGRETVMGREQQSPRRAREKLAHRGAYRKNQFP